MKRSACVCGTGHLRGVHCSWCPVAEARRKDSRIRTGDTVRVVDPQRVVRVGYPRCMDDYSREVVRRSAADIRRLVESTVGPGGLRFRGWNSHAYDEIVSALAYRLAQTDRWGGSMRSVHTLHVEEWRDRVVMAEELACARVGFYESGFGHAEDYEPPGLGRATSKVLVRVSFSGCALFENLAAICGAQERFSNGTWFPRDCLQKEISP